MHLTFIPLIFLGSQLHRITNTVDRPAEAGLEEVEEEPVALQCQIPGTKQLTKAQIFQPLTPSMQQMLDEGTHP